MSAITARDNLILASVSFNNALLELRCKSQEVHGFERKL